MRRDHREAAQLFVEQHFANCDLAILAGSTVRKADTSTSDLDIVIIDRTLDDSYRESFVEWGWPIEVFVHTPETLLKWIEKDILRRKPSMPSMIAEGLLIRGSQPYFEELKHLSTIRMNNGPAPYTDEEDRTERYFLGDLLDDFIGATNHIDEVFILNQLLEKIIHFKLVKSGQWLVHGKRIQSALVAHDRQFAETLFSVMTDFYQTGNKEAMTRILESILAHHGGRVFEGYSVGKT